MDQTIYTELYENRLLENNVQIAIFEECLNRLADDFKDEDIVELCRVLDDNTMEFEVMFGVIHLLETLSSEEAFMNTIKGVVELKRHSPIWAKTIIYRCLNDYIENGDAEYEDEELVNVDIDIPSFYSICYSDRDTMKYFIQ